MSQGIIRYLDLGLMEYKEAWDYQVKVFNQRIARKLENRELPEEKRRYLENLLLFTEHPHVYTLGKSGRENNLLANEDLLSRIGATYFQIDRGGDITYHGPGQIVGYPVFDLEQFGIHLKQYVHSIEECIIIFLKENGISASRLHGATGVWIDPDKPTARKICAIGVKASRFITMHGFAFNINTDLKYFNYINPCGFTDKGVTSLSEELGSIQDMEWAKIRMKEIIIEYFSNIKTTGLK
jgi:lipoyl(octanoyl) transferase